MTRGEDSDKVRAATSENAQEMLAEIEKLRAAYAVDPKSLDRSYPLPTWNPREPMQFVYYWFDAADREGVLQTERN